MYSITHQGIPLGTIDSLPPSAAGGTLVSVAVQPLPGFAAVRPLVRAATIALRNLIPPGAGGPPPDAPRDRTALRRAAELGRALELRDERGMLVPVDFLELTEWPGSTPEVAVLLRLRDAHAGVVALVPAR